MAVIGDNLYGWFSDYVGRKKLTLWYCGFLVAFGVPVFHVLHQAAVARSVSLALVGTTMAAMLKLGWGIVPAYLSERFPTKQRSVGVDWLFRRGTHRGSRY